MSKFRVGQRVRVVYAATMAAAGVVGKVGTVTEVVHGVDVQIRRPRSGYGLDIYPIERTPDGLLTWADDQLEPATDCYDKTEWEACCWKPDHLRVGA